MTNRFINILLVVLLTVFLVAAAPLGARLRYAFNASDDSWVRNGKDIIFYSDELSTSTMTLEGAAGSLTLDGNITSSAGNLTLTSGNATLTSGNITVTSGNVTLSDGNLVVADDLRITAQTVISPTDGGVITATGTYQPLSSAGTVTPTLETSTATAGDTLVLVNTTNTTINLADTGNQVLSAAWAGGQYDSLSLIFDGTRWIETARSDN